MSFIDQIKERVKEKMPGRDPMDNINPIDSFNEPSHMSGESSLQDRLASSDDGEGPMVRLSVGRGWKKARVIGVDENNGTVTVKYKSGVRMVEDTVPEGRILTEDELKAVQKSGSSVRVRR